MYFDFEDYHPDITPVGRAISWREGILLSIIAHLAMVIFILVAPRFIPDHSAEARAQAVALAEQRAAREQARFVFVSPRKDVPARRAPQRAEPSDLDREARSRERSPNPANTLPYSRGNSPERVESVPQAQPRGQGPAPDPAAGQQAENRQPPDAARMPESQSALQLPNPATQMARNGANGSSPTPGGRLGDALRNLQRYTQNETFENPQGNGQFGPEIQFDTKGVEFGPWIRRFIAQVKRNWFIPYAAMSMQGHVVITFNVHKDGSITDLNVAGPSAVDAFNNAAFGALKGSNPTQPLPTEYPSDKAFFTVTFFYNESPR